MDIETGRARLLPSVSVVAQRTRQGEDRVFYVSKITEVRVRAQCGRVLKDILWVSLQDDRARNEQPISIGLFAEDFLLPGFMSIRGDERTYIDLAAQHGREAITGPHVTLHGAYFHIRSRQNAPLFQGLVWTTPKPWLDAHAWLRVVSPPLRDLGPARTTKGRGSHLALLVPSLDRSVAVHFDFVRPERATRTLVTRFISWGGVTLRMHAYTLPPQEAALEWILDG